MTDILQSTAFFRRVNMMSDYFEHTEFSFEEHFRRH